MRVSFREPKLCFFYDVLYCLPLRTDHTLLGDPFGLLEIPLYEVCDSNLGDPWLVFFLHHPENEGRVNVYQ